MDVPRPLPRRKSIGNAFASDSTDHDGSLTGSPALRNSKVQLVHKVEVHTSAGNGSASSENGLIVEKRKKRLRRKSTFSITKKNIQTSEESLKNNITAEKETKNDIKKNGNETFSEDSSPSSNKIKLIPVSDAKKKKPSGYATETLSDESDLDDPLKKPVVTPRLKVASYPSENENLSPNEVLSVNNSDNSNSRLNNRIEEIETKSFESSPSPKSPPPMPFPRKSLNKSLENILASEINKNIQGSPQSYCTSSSLDYRDTGSLSKRPKKHKKKRKSRDANLEEDPQASEAESKSVNDSILQLATDVHSKVLDPPKTNDFICITIQKCEPLQIRDFRTRPFIKVVIFDIENGKQKMNSKGEAIGPVNTQSYDYGFQKSSTLHWDEDLIIMEKMDVIANPKTILLLSIIDEEKNKVIAWGFLKLIAANGASNVGKVLRLQLFKPGKSSKENLDSQVFVWWKNGSHKNYKSTLFMAVNGIPENMIVHNKATNCKKDPIGEASSPQKLISKDNYEKEDDDLKNVKWGRLPSLSCKLPNKYMARLPAGPDGSIAIAYSHSGLFLASANKVSLCVYTYKGRLYLSLRGHQGLVYCLRWSSNDKYLLSASADFLACVWDISNKVVSAIQTVSHPSYVYSCAWLDNNSFVTGCFDNDIRLWKIESSQLFQQISHHKGKINTLLYYDDYLISGDSVGEICIWNWNPGGKLELQRTLTVHEIKGKVINKLSLHPGKKRLLVHTRDSVLRLIDISTGSVLHWFQGLVNNKLREDSTFCGCGSLVLAWSEDSTLCAWDSNTGSQAAIYPGLIPDSYPGVVDFHPHDHMMAISGHSSQAPILAILTFDRLSNGREVGLVPLDVTRGLSTLSLHSDRSPVHSSERSSDSTPRKKEGILKTLLGPKKKVKKENLSLPIMDNSFTDFSRFSNGTSRQLDMTDSFPKENRLTDIIKRMDRILTSVSNNSSLYT